MSKSPMQKEFKIIKHLLPKHQRKSPPSLQDNIPFGTISTDHMLICDFLPQKGGWQTPEILPYAPFSMNPSALVFHYGQTIFEGLKAYRSGREESKIFLFRPEKNAARMAHSAVRLGMEPFPEDLFLTCVKEFVSIESNWVLPSPGALYLRPSMIPLDEGVSYRASKAYRFFVLAFPTKSYFAKETAISVYIEREMSRAAVGGSGEAKCGGNYAAALQSLNLAKSKGADQVLWLDAFEHKYVEEAGAMNVMFVYDKKIVTPALSGSILHGVTRESIIEMARSLGFQVDEKKIEIEQIIADARSGKLTEVFACGTAAVISAIGSFIDGEKTISVTEGKVGDVTLALKKQLLGIQADALPDPYGWRVSV